MRKSVRRRRDKLRQTQKKKYRRKEPERQRFCRISSAWTTRTCTREWRKRIRMDMSRLWRKIRLP